MAISSPGIGSGLDVNSIIAQLVTLERKPILQIQGQIGSLQGSISAWGQIKSGLAKLQDMSAKLLDDNLWQGNKATSGNDSVLGVGSTSGALTGSYNVLVKSLAQAQSVRTANSFAAGSALGLSGRLELTQGSWSGSSFTASGTTLSVSINATDTLSDVASNINKLNAGVTAVVVRSGAQENLVLKSRQTGASQGFEVKAYDGSNALITDGTTGLGALSYFNNGSGIVGQTLNYSGQDAAIEIDGVAVSSSTNTFSTAIPGLTLEAKSVSASPVGVGVASDTNVMSDAVKAFQQAFNDLNTTIKTLTRSDPNGQGNGPLRGDQAAIGLLTMLRNYAGGVVPSTSPSRLANIGLIFDRNGSLSLDDAALQSALANPGQVRTLFAESTSGIARRVSDFARDALAANGTASSREKTLKDSVTRKSDEIERLEERVTRSEQRLRAQYSALDVKMAQYSGLSNYITQQLSAWSKPR